MKKHPENMPRAKRPMLRLFIFNGLLLLAVFVVLEVAIQQKADFSPVLKGDMQKMSMLDEKRELSDFKFLQIGMAADAPRKLSHYRNNWVLLNFWATWCAPCIKELPSLEALQEKYAGKGLRVIGIAMDDNFTEVELKAFLKKHNLGGLVPQYWDGAAPSIARSYAFRGYPTTWVIDPYGRHVATYEGDTDWASADSEAFINSILSVNKAGREEPSVEADRSADTNSVP